MIEFIRNTLISRWPEILGLLLTLTSGFLVPWLSRKSGNYKKLNKQIMLYCLLHIFYLGIIPMAILSIGIIAITIITIIVGIPMNMVVMVVSYTILAIMSLFIFFFVMRKSKRMRIMLGKAKEISMRLYSMLRWVAIISIVLSFLNLLFIDTTHEEIAGRITLILSWMLQIWWLFLVAALIWKASEYVYSKIKITMLDGEIFYFDCSPKVCRVYRNYIRILKRDENDVVIQELQINEVAVKQIEYTK